jgi:glutamate-1-semialdehyde 2,1-aminomutase
MTSSEPHETSNEDQRGADNEDIVADTPSAGTAILEDRLASLERRFLEKNPESKRIHAGASRVMPGGNTRSVLHGVPFPISFRTGAGVMLTSADGEQYIDCVSEYSAAMFGHSHPALQEAIQETLKDGFNLGGPNVYEAELAKHLCLRFKSLELVRFCNSGTEANTMCLVAAMAYTGRKKVFPAYNMRFRTNTKLYQIMVFDNGYHGGTLSFHSRESPSNLPHDFVFGKLNDARATQMLMNEDVAAIIVEPMQGAGGLLPATREFLLFLRESATRVGAVLIFDEVMTSRLAFGGLQAHFGVYPDMTTVGKYLGGGFSFGAFGGKTEYMERFDPNSPKAISHSGTFNNNVFSMRVGLAAAKILTEDAITKANSLGDLLRDSLRSLARKERLHDITFTGMGSMVGLHFSGQHADKIRRCVFLGLLEKRVYVGQRGFIALNVCHEKAHIEIVLQAFGEVFNSIANCIEKFDH